MSAFHRYVVETAVARVARFLQGRTVLEMGCGDGFVTDLLARHAQRVHAFDINPRAIAFARMIVEDPHVTFEVASAGQLASAAERVGATVEVVASFEVIEHLDAGELDAFLSQARQVLTPSNGRLILTTPNGARRGSGRNPHHAHEFASAELSGALASAGFHDVRVSGLYLQPPWVRLEHVANTIPFRAPFRALARAGSGRPSMCRTLVCLASAR
jgi:2-polyprenyl-3-methyl-5-hydroxy-6-metoxy-1,4-benzoquinol methylase